ncbi:MAG: hypothetical protein J7K82_08855 [Thermoproteales archaeon]|nr:hypothetical protein [Thermoproteales archaeon]
MSLNLFLPSFDVEKAKEKLIGELDKFLKNLDKKDTSVLLITASTIYTENYRKHIEEIIEYEKQRISQLSSSVEFARYIEELRREKRRGDWQRNSTAWSNARLTVITFILYFAKHL